MSVRKGVAYQFIWTSNMKKIIYILILLLSCSVLFSSCRSTSMPCPSFGHSKAEAYQLGNAPKLKFDKNGRVRK